MQFAPADAAVILGFDPDLFVNLVELPGLIRDAWHRGRLRAEFEVRGSILTMAKHGSSPAQRDFLAMAAAPVSRPVDGPITKATIAHLERLADTRPELRDSPLVPLAERLARQLDDGAGSMTANVARELRTTLAELGAGSEPDDDDDDDIVGMSAALLHPTEP